MISGVRQKPMLTQGKFGVEKKYADVKLSKTRPKVERNLVVDKNKTSDKKFLRIKKTLRTSGSLPLKRTCIQKSFQQRIKISQDSKNAIVPNNCKKLKLGNTDLQKSNEALYEACKVVNPYIIAPRRQHSLPETKFSLQHMKEGCSKRLNASISGIARSDWL